MLRLLSLFLLALAAWAQNDGWKDIFPDANFSQWTRISIPPGKPVTQPSQWKIDKAAGTLVCEGNGGHEMLRYNTEFTDFVMHVEWKYTKLPDENAKYNSGVFVRTLSDLSAWHQAQVALKGGFLFGVTPVHGAPKRVTQEPAAFRVRPPGEWNTFEVVARGRTLSLWVNGAVTSEIAVDVPRGFFGLEAEGWRIEFRNLKVKPLD